MKKLVILFFLFLGGVSFFWGIKNVYAANMNSKTSIYFTETYVYTQRSENINGVTPTGNPPGNGKQNLPKTSETTNSPIIQIGGLLILGTSIMLKNNESRN